MPGADEPVPVREGLRITFDGISKESTPSDILHRLELIYHRVIRQAERDCKSSYGRTLRRTACVILVIDAAENKEKVIATVRRRDVVPMSSGVLVPKVYSQVEAWKRTIREAKKIIVAMQRYALFAERCLDAMKDPGVAPPSEHPSVYFSRFVRPLFGTFYKDLHKHLIRENRSVPDIPERRSPVPGQPVVERKRSRRRRG